jgi:TPR repeat protein
MANGDASMKVSNVLVARQFYQRAAEQGLADAARALAATYDAKELAKLKNLVGVQPDPQLAKKWYAIADALVDQEAAVQSR